MKTRTPSPCQSICKQNKAGFCVGCKRHSSEIQMWKSLPEEVKAEIVQDLPTRNIED